MTESDHKYWRRFWELAHAPINDDDYVVGLWEFKKVYAYLYPLVWSPKNNCIRAIHREWTCGGTGNVGIERIRFRDNSSECPNPYIPPVDTDCSKFTHWRYANSLLRDEQHSEFRLQRNHDAEYLNLSNLIWHEHVNDEMYETVRNFYTDLIFNPAPYFVERFMVLYENCRETWYDNENDPLWSTHKHKLLKTDQSLPYRERFRDIRHEVARKEAEEKWQEEFRSREQNRILSNEILRRDAKSRFIRRKRLKLNPRAIMAATTVLHHHATNQNKSK